MDKDIDHEELDSMLFRKAVAIRDGVLAGPINMLWADFMLQQIVENNRSGTFALRKTWLTLQHPSSIGIANVIREIQDNDVRQVLERQDFSVDGDEADLFVATAKNLFIPQMEESEGRMRAEAYSQELEPCPAWVIPALLIAYNAKRIDRNVAPRKRTFYICLGNFSGGRIGISFGTNHVTTWFSPSNRQDQDGSYQWLFVKPRAK